MSFTCKNNISATKLKTGERPELPRELRPVGSCGLSAELDRHRDLLQPVLWQAGDQSSSGLCAAPTGAVLRGSETCGGTSIHKAKQHRYMYTDYCNNTQLKSLFSSY